eukprot:TRINITY_DN900_c0_g1_i2.p1 TRINITY_DN900_c0_g1~~TRINITY_DN900_c0_g1_i2.p1  ORF type:complete len:1502 (+),score=505.93 TRINITY_DN900_c0_g1_i2:123-4508(+)
MPIITGSTTSGGWGWGHSPLPPPKKGAPALTPARRRALLAALDPQVLDSVIPNAFSPKSKDAGPDDDLAPLLGLLGELGAAPMDVLQSEEVTEFARMLHSSRMALIPAPPRGAGLMGHRPQLGGERRAVDIATVPEVAHWIWGDALRTALARQDARPRQFQHINATAFLRSGGERALAVCRVETPWAIGTGVLLEPAVLLVSSSLVATAEQAKAATVVFFAESSAPYPACELSLDPKSVFGCTAGQRFDYSVLRTEGNALLVRVTLQSSNFSDVCPAPPLPGSLVSLDCAPGVLLSVDAEGEDGSLSLRNTCSDPLLLGDELAGVGVMHTEGAAPGCSLCALALDPSRLSARQAEGMRAAAACVPLLGSEAQCRLPSAGASLCCISQPPQAPGAGLGDKVICAGALRVGGTPTSPELLAAEAASGTHWLTAGAPLFAVDDEWRLLGLAGTPMPREGKRPALVRALSMSSALTALQRRGVWDSVTGRATRGLGAIDAPAPAPAAPLQPSPPAAAGRQLVQRPGVQYGERTLQWADNTPAAFLGHECFGSADRAMLQLPPFSIELRGPDGTPDTLATHPGCSVTLTAHAVPSGELTVRGGTAPLARGRARFTSVSLHPCPAGAFRLHAVATVALRGTVRYPLSLRHIQRRKPPGHGCELTSVDLWCDVPPPDSPGEEQRKEQAAVRIQAAQRGRVARAEVRRREQLREKHITDEVGQTRRGEAALCIQLAQRRRAARAAVRAQAAALHRSLEQLQHRDRAAQRIQRAQRQRAARDAVRYRRVALDDWLYHTFEHGDEDDRYAAQHKRLSLHGAAPAGPIPTGPREIRILHFNDVYHTECRGNPVAARLASALQQFRQKGPSLTLFSGDAFSPSIHATVTKGAHMPPVLNELGVECSVVGNHDLDFGVDRLEELAGHCNFPWLLTNVTDKLRNNQPLGGSGRTLILPCQGSDGGVVNVGLMGIVEEDWILTCGQLNPQAVRYLDGVETAKQAAEELRQEGAHFIIALTHMRTPNDCVLAEGCGQGVLDLILGGHDHDAENITVNGVPIVKSGSDFFEFSELVIKVPANRFDPASDWVSRGGEIGHAQVDTLLVKVDKERFEPDPGMLAVMKQVTDEINSGLGRVVAISGCDFDCSSAAVRTQEAAIGNWITDVARWGFHHVQCELALLQGGCMRANRPFHAGPLTLGDLLAIIPIEDPIVVIELTGEQLVAALEGGLSKFPAHDGRFPQMSGMKVIWDPEAPPGGRVRQVHILHEDESLQVSWTGSPRTSDGTGFSRLCSAPTNNSTDFGLTRSGPSCDSTADGSTKVPRRQVRRQEYRPLQPNQKYRLATSDYLARGKDGYAPFAQAKRIVDCEQGMILPTMLRNYLYLQRSIHRQLGSTGVRAHEADILGPNVMVKKAQTRMMRKLKNRSGEVTADWTDHLNTPFVGLLCPELEGRLLSQEEAERRAQESPQSSPAERTRSA